MKYLLDTNICVYLIKKKFPSVLKKLTSLASEQICLSSITVAELQYGVAKSDHFEKNNSALEQFMAPIATMPFDDKAANHYGDIRAALEKKGKLIGPLDFLIAAHARSLGYVLVTNNTREFSRVPHLLLENWTASA